MPVMIIMTNYDDDDDCDDDYDYDDNNSGDWAQPRHSLHSGDGDQPWPWYLTPGRNLLIMMMKNGMMPQSMFVLTFFS